MKTRKEVLIEKLLTFGHTRDPFMPNKLICKQGTIDMNYTDRAVCVIFGRPESEWPDLGDREKTKEMFGPSTGEFSFDKMEDLFSTL